MTGARRHGDRRLGAAVAAVWLGALAALFTTPALLRADTATEIGLGEAYDLALRNNSDIRVAAEDVEQGRILLKQAITVLFPKLTANAGYGRAEYGSGLETEGTSWGISLSQTIYDGGRVWIAKRGARYTLKAAEEGLRFARQSVLMDLVRRANRLLSAEELLKVAEKRVERVREQLRLAQARLEVGDVPRSGVLSAQVALSGAELEHREAMQEAALAMSSLANLLGVDGPVKVAIPPVSGPATDAPLDVLVGWAMDNRADLAQAAELADIARQEARLAERGGHPDVTITGSYTRYSDEDAFAPERQVAVNLVWPFFQGGLVGLKAREAESRVRQAEAAYDGAADAVRLQVEEAYLTLKTLQSRSDLVKANLQNARENHRLAKARYELGAGTALEVLDAEEELARAENLAVTHRYDLMTARAALLYAMGTLEPGVFETPGTSGRVSP